MKIIRWLLGNIFLILLVVTVIYGYMFWGNLAGDDTPAGKAIAYLSDEFVEVEEFIAAVKAKQAQLSAGNKSKPDSAAAEEVANASDNAGISHTASKNATSNTTKKANNEKLAVIPPHQSSNHSLPNRQGQAVVNESNLTSLSATMPETKPLVAKSPVVQPPEAVNAVTGDASEDAFVTADVEQQLENVDKHGKVIDSAKKKSAVRANWITARKSFFQRKYDLSEQSYQNVIDNTTDNYDAYGELGNVYFNQGKKQQAASAYFEAASILVRKGQISRARTLMGLLRQLDSTKASELQTLIDTTAS